MCVPIGLLEQSQNVGLQLYAGETRNSALSPIFAPEVWILVR
jgi:hypothetical protein